MDNNLEAKVLGFRSILRDYFFKDIKYVLLNRHFHPTDEELKRLLDSYYNNPLVKGYDEYFNIKIDKI